MSLTKDDRIALRMQLIRNHGEVVTEQMKVEDISNIIGFNYRMTELEAAVSIGQFKNLDVWNKKRRELAEYLTLQLSTLKGIGSVPRYPPT